METKKLKAFGGGHEEVVYGIDVSSDGMHVASVSGDMTARVWDMHGNEVGRYLTKDILICVAFFPDNRHLAVGSMDNSVHIVDWRSGFLVEVLRAHTDHCYGVDILPLTGKIVSASLDKRVIVWSKHRPVEDSSPQGEFEYSVEKVLAGHEVCAEALSSPPC